MLPDAHVSRKMVTKKRTAALSLITFLPLTLCEGQTAYIFLHDAYGRFQNLSFFIPEQKTADITHSASAAGAMIDTP